MATNLVDGIFKRILSVYETKFDSQILATNFGNLWA